MGDSWNVHLVRAEQSDWPDGRVIFRPPRSASGWMKLRFHVPGKSPFKATLNFATERGFTSERIITLNFNNGVAEQIVYFSQIIEQFSLDVSAAVDELKSLDVCANPLSRLGITWAALRRNMLLALGGKARRRPSILIGLKLLATGQFGRFFRQLRVNADPDSVEEKQYENWMRRHERVEERIHRFSGQSSVENGPLFSIFIPAQNDIEAHIGTAMESVLRQTYARWELWIPATAPYSQDARIKTPANATDAITETDFLNAALLSAAGEFVMQLRPGDQLAPHALHVAAEMLQKQPTTDLLYSDEDTMNETGARSDAFFKPDWSPEYLLASMYIGQAVIYRTALVKEVGGFRGDHAAAQGYDLALRLSHRTSSIIHVPEILYHRRPGYRRDAVADARVVEACLQSRNMTATVHPSPQGDFHLVRYPIIGRPLVSILMASACKPVHIPPSNTSATPTAEKYWALNSLSHLRQKATYDRLELILLTPPRIDGDLAKALDAIDVIRCVYREPFNFSSATNQAAAMSHGEHLLLLNDDTELISPDFIERLLSFSQQDKIGVVGAKLLYSDGTIQHAGIVMPGCSPGHPFHDKPRNSGGYHHSAQLHRNYLAVTAACMMTRRSVFNELRGFDESFHMNYNDVDYCLRAVQKGYRVVYQPEAELYHHESMSKPPIQRSELRKFQERWANVYPLDPFYHREFRAEDCSFVLRS